ncbi:hypothetical protein [Streptosporangium sp. NPDC000396]|uniref:hypothetical protein n=1 Tax=Streptosporangium sp. NPDC000396 TaxID=3366185 RepID=UPI0036B99085
MAESKVNAPSTGEESTKRMVMAGAVGIILPVGLLAWAALMAALFRDSPRCGHYTGCLIFLVETWVIGRWIAIVLAWPLLYLLRVRPTWPVAILGALFLVAIWRFAEALSSLWPVAILGTLFLIVFSGVIAYPLAARLTVPHFPRRLLVICVALFFALYVFSALLPG